MKGKRYSGFRNLNIVKGSQKNYQRRYLMGIDTKGGSKNGHHRLQKNRPTRKPKVNKSIIFKPVPVEEGRKNIIFVPDTNVFMSDPEVLFNLGEHDILLSWKVFGELDENKVAKGKKEEDGEQSLNARKSGRFLNYFAQSVPVDQLYRGVPLVRPGEKKKRGKVGRLYFNKPLKNEKFDSIFNLDPLKADYTILHECLEFMHREEKRTGIKRTLILLSNDKNMRTAALILGIRAEDYRNNAPTEESLRSTGMHYFPLSMLKVKGLQAGVLPRPIAEQDGKAEYVLHHRSFEHIIPYEFVIFGPPVDPVTKKQLEPEKQRQYVVIEKINQSTMLVRELYDYQFTKKVFYLHARNVGQNCLVNAIMHLRPELVIGEGEAGTGKTLLVLACAFQQVQDGTRTKILITRDAVESAEKLGFLPGTLEAKVKHFLIGFEGNRVKLIEFLNKNIAEKRKSNASRPVEVKTTVASDMSRVRKTKAQKREERKNRNRNNTGGKSGNNTDCPEVLALLALREKLMGSAIRIVSLSHLRGANIEKFEVVIVDEAQHTDAMLGKMLASRVIDGGMLVLIGNTEQDDIGIPFRKSGVAKLIDATKGTDLMSLVTLLDGERGRLPTRIAKHYK